MPSKPRPLFDLEQRVWQHRPFMGGFYGSVHVRSTHHTKVLEAAAHVCAVQRRKCFVSPVIDGWIAIYPDEHGQDSRFGAEMAQRIGGDVLNVVVHDDSSSYYWLWRNRRLVDRYVSAPGSLEIALLEEEEPLCGRPEAWEPLVGLERTQALRDVFRRDDEAIVFEHERLLRLAELVGLANPVCAYEYLEDGETEDVVEWDSFVQLPKPSNPAKLRLIGNEPDGPEPVVVLRGRGRVFPAWTGFVRILPPGFRTVQHLAPPDWEPVPLSLPFEDAPHVGVVDSTGRIAAFSLPGRVAVVELERGILLTEVATKKLVHALSLSAGGARLAHVDDGELRVEDLPRGRSLLRRAISGDNPSWHPNGRWLATRGHQTTFFDLDDGTSHDVELATERIDLRLSFERETARLLSFIRDAGERENVKANSQRMLDALTSGPLANGIPLDQVRSFDWSRDGSTFWLVSTTGIRVFEWERLRSALHAGISTFPTPAWYLSEDQAVVVADGIDSESILLGTNKGAVQRLDRATGSRGRATRFGDEVISIPSVSLDREWVAVTVCPMRKDHELRVVPATPWRE